MQGSYIAVDYHVTAMLTLFLGWSTYYVSPGRCKVNFDSPGPLAGITGPRYTINKAFQGHWGFLMVLFAITFFTSPWMYWKGNYIGHKPGCPTKFLFCFVFYSAIIDIYNPKWVLAVKILSVPDCVLGLVCLVYGLSLLLLHACTPPSDNDEASDIDGCMKATYTIVQLVLGGWVIAIAELTIRRNKLDLSGVQLTSSGQLIPLLVGAMALGVVFGNWVRSGVRKLDIPAASAAYMATVTKTADAIRDRFRTGKGKAQDTSVELETPAESQQSQEDLRRPSNSDTESRSQSQRNLP
ncbi:MAG: hypothetical protein M1840_006294 [Geoglossum simile]|nr:MAG: hypothetical protein M1840_006294 [Geoglossum simile]